MANKSRTATFSSFEAQASTIKPRKWQIKNFVYFEVGGENGHC